MVFYADDLWSRKFFVDWAPAFAGATNLMFDETHTFVLIWTTFGRWLLF